MTTKQEFEFKEFVKKLKSADGQWTVKGLASGYSRFLSTM